MKLAIFAALFFACAECVAKDIVEKKLTPASQLVLQYDETDAKTTYRLQFRKSGQLPVEFYFKEVAKEAGKHSEWLSLLDALESDGKVTALVATDIGSFILLQGAADGRLESQQGFLSQALAMTLNSGDGKVRLIAPREIVFRPVSFTDSVTAAITPKGELLVDGKPFVQNGGTLTVGTGASQSSAVAPDGAATGAAAQGEEISRKINGGTIKEILTPKDAEHYVATLYWQPDGGEPVVIDRAERSRIVDPQWTLSAGYFDGNKIALWRIKSSNLTEYWGFTEKEGNWKLTDRAFLESATVMPDFNKAHFTSVRTLELLKGKKVSVRYEVTEQPRGGDALYRKVLRNGVEWTLEGTVVGTEAEALLAAIRAKSGATVAAPAPATATASAGAKDIKVLPLGNSVSMVLQSEEADQKTTYSLQLRQEGSAPTEFWRKEVGTEKVPGKLEEWVKMVDGIEANGRVTVLVQTYISSFVLLQGGENGRVDSEIGFLSGALEAAGNSVAGSIKLKSPTEVVITSRTYPNPVTATITPKGELLVDGKPIVQSGGRLTVGGGVSQASAAMPDGAATGTGTGAQTSASAIAPAPEARARKEISRRINGGIIKEVETHKDAEHYVATLYWMPDGGVPVVIDRAERSRRFDPCWTLRAGYFDGNRIALWRWSATNSTEYWGFTEKEGNWQMTDRAPLGTCTGLAFDNVRFASVRRLELTTGKRVSTRFDITEESRGGDPVYRKVLRNGVEWNAPGVFFRGDTEESLAAVAAKSSRPGELLLIIDKGIIVQTREPKSGDRYVTTLYWQLNGGNRVVVDQSEQSSSEDMHWTLEAGYFDGENIALWRDNASGMTEYWCYMQQKDSKWKLTKRAQLGTFRRMGIDEGRFSSLRTLEILKGNVVKATFDVTDTPRGGDPVYCKVLLNGVEWAPRGTSIGTELQDLAEAQKRKPRTAPGAIVKPVDSAAGSVASESPSVASSDQPNNRSRLPWVAGGVVVLLGVGWLLWRVVRR